MARDDEDGKTRVLVVVDINVTDELKGNGTKKIKQYNKPATHDLPTTAATTGTPCLVLTS